MSFIIGFVIVIAVADKLSEAVTKKESKVKSYDLYFSVALLLLGLKEILGV